MSEKKTLTKVTVDAAPKPEKGESRIWDEDLPGFCLRIYATGRKVYALKYRVDGRQRWFTIGVHGAPGPDGETWTPALARKRARSIAGAAADGVDKSDDRRQRRAAGTVSDLIDLYLEEGPATRPNKRDSSWNADRGNLRHHVQPLIGKSKVNAVTRSDVQRMLTAVIAGETGKEAVKTKLRGRARVRGGAGIAPRVLAATSAMFSWGVDQNVLADNPARGIKLPKRAAKERFLSLEEAQSLLAKIKELEDAGDISKAHADIVRLLFFTGARRAEVTELQASEIDLERKRIVLPPERTKAGGKTGVRRIPLNAAALAIVKEYLSSDGYFFPASRGEGPTTGVGKAWDTIREAAELPGVRLHDLRHSWASFAVADGASLYLIGKALGHSDTRTTERYAHLTDDPLQELAEQTGKRLTSQPKAKSEDES